MNQRAGKEQEKREEKLSGDVRLFKLMKVEMFLHIPEHLIDDVSFNVWDLNHLKYTSAHSRPFSTTLRLKLLNSQVNL